MEDARGGIGRGAISRCNPILNPPTLSTLLEENNVVICTVWLHNPAYLEKVTGIFSRFTSKCMVKHRICTKHRTPPDVPRRLL